MVQDKLNNELSKIYLFHKHSVSDLQTVKLFKQLHTKTSFFSDDKHVNCKTVLPEKARSVQHLQKSLVV